MGATSWFTLHSFDIQTVGIMGSLLVAAFAVWKDAQARRVGNVIAINDQYIRIWRLYFEYPELERVLDARASLRTKALSSREELFVTMLINHLGNVHRAKTHHESVVIEGLPQDVREFFALPIPKAVWNKTKPFQDAAFVKFVDGALES